ncbi:MAG: hypothetical protein LUF78_07600 [Clostridiales bacterium]|nr:hypothetical protein [Clostridiales bacterium]
MREFTTQEQMYFMGVETVCILEKTTPERFEQYRAEFMEQASSRSAVKKMLEAVFDLVERKRFAET